MKKLILLLLITSFTSYSQTENQTLLLGLKYGMTKSEAKSEFKKNKDKYTNITLGSYLWRHYHQNNEYDKDGGLTLVQAVPKGGGLFGLPKSEAKLVYNDLIRMLTAKGYEINDVNTKGGNYFEFSVGQTYLLKNIEKGLNVYIGTPASPTSANNVYLQLVIGKYEDVEKTDYSNSAL